jgi:hypothetical protein
MAAATLKGGTGSTVLLANNDINVLNLNTLHSSLNDSYSESSAALRSSSSTNTSNANAVMVQSSNIAGGNVTLQSGNDLKV